MSSLGEDQFVRAERQRKQELYRLMLDQQVRYNQDSKRETDSYPLKPNPQERRNPPPRVQEFGASPEGRYLPAIGNSQRELSVGRTPVRGNESDRTQVYLSNCEEIIKNLRDLKSKRKSRDIAPVAESPPVASALFPIQQKPPNYEVQYYPKPSYFSSAGSSFNKNSHLDTTPKASKLRPTRLKTLEDSQAKKIEETPVKIAYKSIRSKSTKSKGIGKQKGEVSEEMKELTSRDPSRDPEKESDQPLGIVDAQRKQAANGRDTSREPAISKQDEQNRKKQEELSLCLIELTKYLKNLNDQKQQSHSQTHHQGSLAADKVDRFNQREDMLPVSHKAMDKKDASTHHDQILEKDPEEEEDQQEVPTEQPETNVERLKLKALLALRKLNQRSHSFMLKMGSKRTKHSDKTSEQSTEKSPSQQPDSKSSPRTTSPQLQIQSRQASSLKGEPTTISSGKHQENKVNEKSSIQPNSVEKGKSDEKGDKKSEELVKLMMHQLEKQQGQNDNLTYCIKELTEYLKNQNEEIDELKYSRSKHHSQQEEENDHQEREQSVRAINKKDSNVKHQPLQKQIKPNEQTSKPVKNETEKVRKLVKTEQSEEEKADEIDKNEKDNAHKLQQAVLKRLKKARMRGSLFKQKVENFRKQHNTRSEVSNKPPSSVPDEPSEADAQVSPDSNDLHEDP